MAHGQALAQTVALARLLDAYPVSEGERLATAFGSKFSCARVSDAPAPAHAMSAPERRLADLIAVMLHGVKVGPPQIAIKPLMPDVHPCGAGPRPDRRAVGDEDDGRRAGPPEFRSRFANVAIAVPLSDGRWLTFTTAVHAPGGWTRATTLSFLLSCLSVSAVAFVAVRAQTRSLRALAEASERLGRGESVPPLSTTGPSEVAAAARAFNTMQEHLFNNRSIRDRIEKSLSPLFESRATRRILVMTMSVGPERLSPWRRREMLAVMQTLANVPSLIAQLMSKLEIGL